MEPEYLQRLVETEARSKSNTKRLDEMEKTVDAVHEMAKSVGILATNMEHMAGDMKETKEDVKALKQVPARRWEQVVEKILFGLVFTALGVIVTAVVSKFV